MKSTLRFMALLLVGLSLGLSRPALASHAQGGDLSYTYLGPSATAGAQIYRVTCRFYRDCSGIAAPTSLPLTCRNTLPTVCAGGTTVSVILTLQMAPVYGTQYCATVTGVCTTNGPANFESNVYAGNVTLPAGQWTLSVEENARPSLANISGNNTLRLEATLDSRNGLQNTSPSFSSNAATFIPYLQNSVIVHNAFDADGDSLVYTLDRPMSGCNTYDTYANFSNVIMLPPNNGMTCVASIPGAGTYSPTFPLPSYAITGTCPLKTAVPNFQFDPATGALSAEPAIYDATSASAAGANKYVVVVKVSEYRRVNGAQVFVGSVRRDLLLTVYDCGTNTMPRLAANATVQYGSSSRVQPLGQIITVDAGEPISVTFSATDANTGQILNYHTDYNAVPGVQLQRLASGEARLTFQPPLTLRNGLYRVAITAEDNACPIKGQETKVLTFRVINSPLAGKKATLTQLTAFPNPFTEQVQFQLSKGGVQTLTITDNLGRVVGRVSSQADGKVQWLPGAEVPAGLYLARTADGQQTVRLLRSEAR